jgi:uncharacterized protein (TIGR03067 family)
VGLGKLPCRISFKEDGMLTKLTVGAVLVLVVVGVTTAIWPDESKDEAVKKELAKLKGTWKSISWMIDGTNLTEFEQSRRSHTFDWKSLTLYHDGLRALSGWMEIDPTKSPSEMTISWIGGEVDGMVCKAIYKLEGML